MAERAGVHPGAIDDRPRRGLTLSKRAVDSDRVRESMPDVDPSHFVPPSAICDEIVHLINQSKSAWTFQVDMRSFA